MDECWLWGPISTPCGFTVRSLSLNCSFKWWSNAPYCLNIELWFQLGFTDGTSFEIRCRYQILITFFIAIFPGIEYLHLCYSSIFLGSFRNYLFVFSDDTMELPFDSRENEYWLFFLIQSSSMKMRWPLDITRKYFNCLNFRNLIGGAAAGALL